MAKMEQNEPIQEINFSKLFTIALKEQGYINTIKCLPKGKQGFFSLSKGSLKITLQMI